MGKIDHVELTTADYPLAEKRPELIKSADGKELAALTLDAVVDGSVGMADLRITSEALRLQADIARSAGRPTLGENFERAAELVNVPQDDVMRIYELLRPGRAKSKDELLDAARTLRNQYAAPRMAAFIEEAADVYERRGLFVKRY